MIMVDTYFLASCGEFKACPTGWAEKALRAVQRWQTVEFDGVYTRVVGAGRNKNIRLGNHEWRANFVSYSGKWGSLSAYWVSPDGQWLLRLSDHWSKATGSCHRSAREIGWIRSCWWELAGDCRPASGKFFLGICRIASLESVS